MGTTEVHNISYANWLFSAQKWVSILEKVKKEEHFSGSSGFDDLSVVSWCGYCDTFWEIFCWRCPLLKKRNLCFF
ncbi:MAG: hypothetical protein KAJ58_02140 [Candidatus Pacebacteria bacterium]|nr:hypothetical protein [Candidatus Paceibacterota bacterium]